MKKMVTRTKRSSYVTETETSSDEDVECFTTKRSKISGSDPFKYIDRKSKSKCASKNALMARENRRRKKLHMQNLENELNKLKNDKSNLVAVMDNQSLVITDLRKEIRYLRSVLANSSDISNLIKNIGSGTGMSVTTSLDKNLNNYCVSKPKTNIARKTAHPWENNTTATSLDNTILSDDVTLGQFDISNFNLDLPLLDIDIPLVDSDQLLNESCNESNYSCKKIDLENLWSEHNYTSSSGSLDNLFDKDEDVGVCLHVSKHRVSLEFCPSCSDNALQTWKEQE